MMGQSSSQQSPQWGRVRLQSQLQQPGACPEHHQGMDVPGAAAIGWEWLTKGSRGQASLSPPPAPHPSCQPSGQLFRWPGQATSSPSC